MKKIRLVAIAAIMFFSASAFTKATHAAKFDTQVWHLNTGGNSNTAADYEPGEAGSCSGSGQICEINDVESSTLSNKPALSFGDPMSNKVDYDATERAQ